MKTNHVKQAWTTWQEQHAEEAATLRARFATKAIEHGFVKAEHYLVLAIMDRLQLSYVDVRQALA